VQKLGSCFGLTPKVRQSGGQPAPRERISQHSNGDARKMLVGAARSVKTAPAPLRAFAIACSANEALLQQPWRSPERRR